ncbi:MAG: Helicase associated domain protein [Lachnospiraceae bacterium]|nr:Helicase associated domain protein [Lachnospiraceae bacterium]
MSIIPIIKKPYPDELLYSWIHRMADENLLSFTMFSNTFLGTKHAKQGDLTPDVRLEFREFYKNMYRHYGSMDTMYLGLTTFRFESMVMTPRQQTRYVNRVFRGNDALNSSVNMAFQKIKICNVCVKEDRQEFGQPYIHRAHQLSGVCTCHKHGIKLSIYCGKKGHECEFNEKDYQELSSDIPLKSLQAFTNYAQALFEAELNTDAYQIKTIVFDGIRECGYQVSNNYYGLKEALDNWEHANLWNAGDITSFLKIKMISAQYVTIEEVFPLLMFAYNDVSILIKKLNKSEALLESFVCNECGREYCATPASIKDGWGCPYCEESIPEQDRFQHLVKTIGHGRYKTLTNFRSMDAQVRFLHKDCGKELSIKPRGFLFEGVRCKCESIVTETDARKLVEKTPGFQLVKFTSTNDPVIIRHEKCGCEFSCRYHKFLNFPGCRVCNPPIMTAEIYKERVKDLVGDEYTIIKPFTSQQEKVILRHNICGCEQAYKPSAFLDGQRCRKCSSLLPHKDLESTLERYSSGQYIIISYGRNVCTVMDTETGKTIQMAPLKIMQEITRKTPSSLLPAKQGYREVQKPESIWEHAYQKLLKYANEFGNVNVPKRMAYDGFNLGLWCQHQRDDRKNGTLNEMRIQQLDSIGFSWDPLEEEWMRRYDQYGRYAKQTGSPYISKRTDFEGEHLGVWVNTQRLRYRNGKLSKEREERLLKINPNLFHNEI